MKVRRTFFAALVVGTAVGTPLRQAHAGAGYTCTLTYDTRLVASQQSTTTLTKPDGADKIVIAPSKKKGDGGSTIQIVTKDINCGSICNNNVIDLGVRALGNDVPHTAGILFNVSGGKAVFPSNGKNKVSLGSLFGSIGQLVINQSLGIGLVELREPGTDPTACSAAPLQAGSKCNDGNVYAVCGFKVPLDPGIKQCAVDTDCALITSFCDTSSTPHLCKTETCTADADCRSPAQCDFNNGTCCASGVGAGCP